MSHPWSERADQILAPWGASSFLGRRVWSGRGARGRRPFSPTGENEHTRQVGGIPSCGGRLTCTGGAYRRHGKPPVPPRGPPWPPWPPPHAHLLRGAVGGAPEVPGSVQRLDVALVEPRGVFLYSDLALDVPHRRAGTSCPAAWSGCTISIFRSSDRREGR